MTYFLFGCRKQYEVINRAKINVRGGPIDWTVITDPIVKTVKAYRISFIH